MPLCHGLLLGCQGVIFLPPLHLIILLHGHV